MSSHSTKPYLIRAIHEWCSDQGHTPYLAVAVDEHTIVPMEYVKGGEIVLNVSLAATNRLRLGNDWIEFQARFGGVARDISIPISHVSAIYARETGHGMAFEVSKPQALLSAVDLSKSQAALPSPDEAHPQVGTGSPVSRAPNQLAAVPAAEPAIASASARTSSGVRRR
ncbi:MAG: ClpXP protease specificity-enhancing factor [Betaproteobacteria bacterium]|nr:ClpXP protease specificity-enhancing factor [Betaproteobacteria bacterium]